MESPGSGFAAVVDYGQYGCTCPRYWWSIYPPPPCSWCQAQTNAARQWWPVALPSTPLVPQPLSDNDVERIAKRVAELLRGSS